MKLFVVLAVLCASASADERETISNDLDGAINSIINALTTATNMVSRTVAMKLDLKRSCWKRLTNDLTSSSEEAKNMATLTKDLNQLVSKIANAPESDMTQFVKKVLTAPNTPILRILSCGDQMANALEEMTSKLNLNTQCS